MDHVESREVTWSHDAVKVVHHVAALHHGKAVALWRDGLFLNSRATPGCRVLQFRVEAVSRVDLHTEFAIV